MSAFPTLHFCNSRGSPSPSGFPLGTHKSSYVSGGRNIKEGNYALYHSPSNWMMSFSEGDFTGVQEDDGALGLELSESLGG